ncbi:MAG: RecT family recombinase [Thermoplasmata archaeon]
MSASAEKAASFRTAKELLDEEQGNAVVPASGATLHVRVSGLTQDQIDVLRRTICRELSDDELLLFLARCQRRGLDPFEDVSVWKDSDGKMTLQARIDWMRMRSRRSGHFRGLKVDLMPAPDDAAQIIGARCTVTRDDVPDPFVAEVLLKELDKGNRAWRQMPETMIKKVAESHALRAAFPEELHGVYETAEIQGD